MVLTSKYVCTHVCMYVCIYVCMYVHINMYVHMSICTYGHTYVNPLFSWFCLSASSGAVQGLKRTFVLAGMEQFLIQLSLSFVGPMRPEAVLPDRALCLPFQSRLDCQLNYLNPKLPLNFSLSLSLSLLSIKLLTLSLSRALSRVTDAMSAVWTGGASARSVRLVYQRLRRLSRHWHVLRASLRPCDGPLQRESRLVCPCIACALCLAAGVQPCDDLCTNSQKSVP